MKAHLLSEALQRGDNGAHGRRGGATTTAGDAVDAILRAPAVIASMTIAHFGRNTSFGGSVTRQTRLHAEQVSCPAASPKLSSNHSREGTLQGKALYRTHLMSEELAPAEVELEPDLPEPDSLAADSSCARSATMKSGVSISACAQAFAALVIAFQQRCIV